MTFLAELSRGGRFTDRVCRDDMYLSKKSGMSFGSQNSKNRKHKGKIFDAVKRSKMMELSKPVYFNVMLCGKSGTGKTKFLKKFLEEVKGILKIVVRLLE